MTDAFDLPAAPARRTPRDWVWDTAVFAAAVLLGLVVLGYVQETEDMPRWQEELDPLLGLIACALLWWRHRNPLAVSLLGLPAVALGSSALPAGAVLVTGMALRLPWRRALPMLGLYVVVLLASGRLLPSASNDPWFDAGFGMTYLLAAFAVGNALRSRRLLVERLRLDAQRTRAEHDRRLAEARKAERAAIAREMHDVLAHRVSLLSVHAGALAYRTRQAEAGAGPALSGAEVAESAEVIRGNAHEAVNELQEVLYLLRAEDGADSQAQSSLLPRIDDIGGLVADAQKAGQRVDWSSDLDPDAVRDLRPQLHRTAYRAVQEGLTNARKHAPGAPVAVRLTGGPGHGLTVEVRNALSPAPATPALIPGTGAGLAGLAERVRLDGGTLETTAADGAFTLRARLPWPAR
ncbi:sensor histidine kinase [Streptomyces boninensis]|uniref:sensor histidine kinase n=1 Tax=Streptomyces boninensis TaxID=2039455 RepID=UPI003B2206AF